MLSQLTLRFHKKLIEALKIRAGHENTSVNALAARFLDDGLKTAAAATVIFSLSPIRRPPSGNCTDISFSARPSAPLRTSRDELRFILAYAREAFICGQNRLATLPALRTLLDITRDLLAWQAENDRTVDRHYLQGIFRLPGDNLVEEFDRFLADLRPVVDQMYAEHCCARWRAAALNLRRFQTRSWRKFLPCRG